MSTTKRSKQREAILDVLKNTTSHPTADWIYSRVRERIPNISLGTVYRNLAKLSDEKIIMKLGLGTDVEHFDGDTSPHYHVMCMECGGICDIHEKPLVKLDEWASGLYEGEIYKHSAIFFGKCKECSK